MAEGLAVRLPLFISKTDGAYGLHKNILSMAEQNLKMVILTGPGERVMEPDFGVGVKQFLFAPNSPGTIGEIKSRIQKQVRKYLPYIEITDLAVSSPQVAFGNEADLDRSRINISIRYIIPAANIGSDFTIPIQS